jgi:hypothetical protein
VTEQQEWLTGEEAAEQTGKTIAEIDQAAAAGDIDAAYHGWQLKVAKPKPEPAPKKAARKRTTK